MDATDVFAALSDLTRRRLVDWLSEEGSGTATGFAARLTISRQAVSRHLNELEQAGLVRSERVGRETRYSLEPEPLSEAAGWLTKRSDAWDRTLRRLKEHVESGGDS